MEEKKRKKRHYLDDFKLNDKGDYEYKGILYGWDETKASYKKEMLKSWGSGIALLAAIIGAGCVDAPGPINCIYVIVPYTACLMMGISTVWGLWRLTSGKNPIKAYDYEASVQAIPARAMCTMGCAVAAFGGHLIFVFQNGCQDKAAGTILFQLLTAGAALLAMYMQHQVRKMPWKRML